MTMNDDDPPLSEENRVPRFLYLTYTLLILGGLIAFILFWNGSYGWFDRGFWQPLQEAAKTTKNSP